MNDSKSVLIVDDEESICFGFRHFFEPRGWDVRVAASGEAALAAYRDRPADVVFLDVRLPDVSGLNVLEHLRAEDPQAHVLIITAYGSLETVARAVRAQAEDILVKPLDLDRAIELADRALTARTAPAVAARQDPPDDAELPTAMVGASPAMQEVYKRIGLVAQSDTSVLILGETGTGKELAARAIHDHSVRRHHPFVAINCGALPMSLVESELFGHVRGAFTGAEADRPGRFEQADGGTLFLDEVGELPPAVQVKLLRVLDSQRVERVGSTESIRLDVRILGATNHDLADDVETGRFRADLFYRLAVVRIALPPLAQRREDIEPLATHFLASVSQPGAATAHVSPEAIDALRHHHWPGNVRELRNAIEHAVLVAGCGPILLEHLPESVREGGTGRRRDADLDRVIQEYLRALPRDPRGLYRAAIEPLEKALVRHALLACGGSRADAARLLGLHRNTLRKKLRDLTIEAEEAQ